MIKKLSSAVVLLFAPWLVASCLTPDFKFGERPKGDAGSGGSGNDGGGPNVADHCTNRGKDADETDIDCGGLDCAPCSLGRACEADGDCVNESCTMGKCQAPTCTDDVKNAGETDTDCGGTKCPPCADDKKCEKPTDCESGVCGGGTCKPATCSDRVKNQGETDIDCAGPCPACDVGGVCVIAEDCEAPPADDPAGVACKGGKCELLCGAGTADCNQKASDGCEVNTNTNTNHCGACNEKCAPANAVAGACVGGLCEIDFSSGGCKTNFADCNGEPSDGCEVNTSSNVDHCGSCNGACSKANGTASCSAGSCLIDCDTGFENCDAKARENGCEVDTKTDTKNCNSCGNVCPANQAANESPFCSNSVCGKTVCSNGHGDCDGNTTCDTPLNTTTNCGSCGTSCTVANGSATCSGGTTCAVASCTAPYANCNGNYADGCETNTNTTVAHCGGCAGSGGTDCNSLKNNASLHIAAITCGSGDCEITGCVTDYADCDGSAANGCEVNIKTDDGRCGGCLAGDANPASGINCTTTYSNGFGNCNAGTCELTGCASTHATCDNIDSNGCETNITNDATNCGGCNVTCQTNGVTSTNVCTAKACFPTCTGSGQNCDANPINGCEDKSSNKNHCGTCGTVCATDSVTASNTCTSGTCVPVCSGAGAVCDGNAPNGCEDTANDGTNCGTCGTTCQTNVGTSSNSCSSSSCAPTCNTNYQSCDGNLANGCESNKTGDANNCGSCGIKCGGSAQTNVSGTPTCSSSTCNVSCTAGMCPNTADAERKCTQPLGTTTNCTSCGEVCSGATKYCTASGCADHLPIVKVNDTTTSVSSTSDYTFTHTLATSRATNPYRAVFLILGNTGNVRFPESVPTYDGNAMTLAASRDSGNQAAVAIYYILDANLPASAKTATVSINGNNFNPNDWTIRIVELSNVDQSTALAGTANAGGGGSSCGNSGNLSVTTTTGAFVITALVEQNNASTATPTDGQTTWTTLIQNDTAMAHGYVADATAGTKQVRWTCTDSEWAHLLVAVNAEGMGP